MKIKGLRKLRRKVNKFRNTRNLNRMTGAIKEVAINVKRDIAEYPPSTAANLPPAPYYERGFGVRYASGAGRRTSEDLFHRWTIRSSRGGTRAEIGNNASYAVFVHSEEKQASFHGRRGWKTDKEVLDDLRPWITNKMARALRRELEE